MRSSKKKVGKSDKEQSKVLACAKSGDLQGIQSLLKKKTIDLNLRDDEQWTPLCWAVFNGHLEVAKELICSGAWVNVKDTQGRSPLYFACGWGGDYGENGMFTKVLLQAGADIDGVTNDDWSSLYLCAFKGRAASARELVKQGANIFLADTQGRTAYDIAVLRKNKPITALLKARAETLLCEYAEQGKTSQMKMILNGSFDIDVNARVASGASALHFAMENGSEAAVKILVEHNADPFLKTRKGKTPQDLAAERGNLVLLKLYRKFYSEIGITIDLPTSTDILRGNISAPHLRRRTTKSQSVLRASEDIRRNIKPTRRKVRKSSSTITALDIEPLHNLHTNSAVSARLHNPKDILEFLNTEEMSIASSDPHLVGLIKQLNEPQTNSELVSLFNLAYGSTLCHLEEFIHQIDNTSLELEDISSLLYAIGIKSGAQIREYSQLFQPKTNLGPDEYLIEKYYALACDDDQLDDIIIDPSLVENYMALMKNSQKPDEHKQADSSSAIMQKLLKNISQKSEPCIQLRRSGSSSELILNLSPQKEKFKRIE